MQRRVEARCGTHLLGLVILSTLLVVAMPTLGHGGGGQQQRRQDGQQQRQQPGFEATVARVRVDVVVTGGDGEFVGDLQAGEFLLFEDGKPQQIRDIQLVDLLARSVTRLDPGHRGDSHSPTGVAPSTPSSSTRTTAAVPPRPTSELGAIILLVDLPGLDRKSKKRFVSVWDNLLAETDELSIPRAAYLIDEDGRLRELAPLTLDLELLRPVGDMVRAVPLRRQTVREELIDLAREVTDLGGLQMYDYRNLIAAEESRSRARAQRTFEMLTQFCNALAAREGRTALVWISSGVQVAVGGPLAVTAAQFKQNQEERNSAQPEDFGNERTDVNLLLQYDARFKRLQELLHRAANSANVSFYTVDPTRTIDLVSIGSGVGVPDPDSRAVLSSPEVRDSLDGLRDSLRDAAAATGGRAFIGWSDLTGALREIGRDTGRFYLLSYAPPSVEGDGSYHEIRVEVRRKGLEVRARAGYVNLSATERRKRVLGAALALPGTATGLPVEARVFRRWSREGKPAILLAAAVEATSTAGNLEGKVDPPSLTFFSTAVDKDGNNVGEIHQELHRRENVSGEGQAAASRPFVYSREWTLEPGRYELRVVARDEGSGRLGGGQVDVEVPEPDPGWSTSDLILIASEGPQRRLPVVGSEIVRGETVVAYLEVSGGRQPLVSGEIFDAGGTVSLLQLPPLRLGRDGAGIYRGALPLPALPTGGYTLRVVVDDRPAGEQREYLVPLRIVEPPGSLRSSSRSSEPRNPRPLP
ncbi:MAG: VWA domain-containing protein [Acidobacteriota bacterium]